ncbi:MAG: knotted carbamoyltransferase YgeW [Acidobacteria bacterium]|nr:MAG: knotted carbamoyltransferase YgeW [Acidobacteriota bacterium]
MSHAKPTPELLGRLADLGVEGLYGRSLLLTREWSLPELETLATLAELLEVLDRDGVPVDLFPNELHLALFFDSSTRTRSSWAGAAARLGARPVVVDGSATQVGHGETAEETGTMLGMNAHALGIRHDLVLGEGNRFMREAKSGIDRYLESVGSRRVVPLVNLQCDIDHPTQTLADWLWLRERFPEGLAGRTLAVTWAYSPSYAKPLSVPQGLITLLTRFGMHIRLAHPEGYQLTPESMELAASLANESGGSFDLTRSMDEAFDAADVVYPKSWGPYELMLERVEASRAGEQTRFEEIEGQALAQNQLHRDWICNEERMAATRSGDALYMHCLPADIGDEVTAGVAARARLDLARQANKKLYVIMAVLAAAKEPELVHRLRVLAESR